VVAASDSHEISGLADNSPGTFCSFPGHVFLKKFALLAVELPAAFRLDLINGAEKLGGSEVFEEKRTETLIFAAVTPKIYVPEAGRSRTSSE
jgi:hypothetical protein